jgi:hypothetical protein
MCRRLPCLASSVLVLSLAVCVGSAAAGNLVAHWTFDENGGTTITDLAGGVGGGRD